MYRSTFQKGVHRSRARVTVWCTDANREPGLSSCSYHRYLPPQGEKSEGKKSRAAPSTANPVAVLQRAVRSFFPPPSRRVYFAPSFPDHASSMKNNDAFLPDIFVEGTTPTRNFVPFWKMNKFLFLGGGIEDVFKSIFYFIYTFCKYLWKKTKFYVVASRFPSTLNGSGFLYFCEKEIFKMEIPGNGSFSGF